MERLMDEIPGGATQKSRWEATYAQAAMRVIRRLGTQDAGAARDIARSVTDSWNKVAAHALASEFGATKERVEFANEAIQSDGRGPGMQSGTMLRLAAMLAPLDDNAAAALFARTLAQATEFERASGSSHTRVMAAFYGAERDPATARMDLEAAWAKLQASPADTSAHNPKAWSAANIASHMAAVDIDRALEMARQIPAEYEKTKQSARARALNQIGRIALTPVNQRWRFKWNDESGFDAP
jgi:hypothetical protein